MLTRLIIHNYAIITQLDLSFETGLTIITGETGAGKSILLGALGLALGKRADSKVVNDANKCIVEAHFSLTDKNIRKRLVEEGWEEEDVLICRREISSGGKSRSFINDSPASLKLIQEITAPLIELHHQHDNLALQTREYQVNALDIMSASSEIAEQYRKEFAQWNAFMHELNRTKQLEAASARKKDFLSFQIKELTGAQLKPGELEELEANQNILKHSEAIEESISHLRHSLNAGPHAVLQQFMQLSKQLDAIKHLSEPINVISSRIDTLRVEIQDLAMEADRLEGLGQNDPAKLGRIESRLTQLYSLFKKYQVKDESDLISLQHSFEKEYNDLESAKEKITELENKIIASLHQLKSTGKTLSQKRKAGAKKITSDMKALLIELGMPNGRFSIDINDLIEPTPDGLDEILFMFSANKGMELQPLQAVASGGELSRLSLAIKSLYAAQSKLPTLIFDEIDTGISGEIAWRMGQMIRNLAKTHQVFMITHSPQVAAHATQQYHVSKKLTGDKDISFVQLLNKEMRLTEIAKMLSGDPPSKEALANAKSLVSSVSK